MQFSLDHVIFFGRTWHECMGMYALEEADLTNRRVLDCPGGPDALVADGLKRGFDMHAVDPQYANDADVLESRGREEITDAMTAWQSDPEKAWDQAEADEYLRLKLEALDHFIQSYRDNKSHFTSGSLPDLPFKANSFDLILSGHFLFLYASIEHGGLMSHDQLDLEFHLAAIRDMIRVAPEVRIYPTYATSGPSRRQPYVEPVMDILRSEGHHVELVPSNWVQATFVEFNDLLLIKRQS